MRRLSSDLIDQLDLVQALDEEVDSWRNQIPPEPWRPIVKAKSPTVVSWIRSRLTAGAPCLPGVVVNARKATIGSRPVPILGIADRVVYRALTKLILSGLPLPDRSPDAYGCLCHRERHNARAARCVGEHRRGRRHCIYVGAVAEEPCTPPGR